MNVTENGNQVKITLSGRIDSNNAAAAEEELLKAFKAHAGKELVIDAEKLTYISSAGLRVLMKLNKLSRQPIEIINVSRDVYDILDVTGFTELFRVRKAFRRLSVEGCGIIGKGCLGTIYRIDDESIVKVYKGKDSLPMIENEIRMAKRAFVSGIPTAIAYDIVQVGEDYGSVFEMLKASTYMEWIRSAPEDREQIVDGYVRFLKQVNETVLEGEALPSAKRRFLDCLDTVSGLLMPDTRARLKRLIEAVPESLHAVHGDCHLNNIMRVDNEPMLIDMDTLSTGNAVFELATVFFTYIPFDEDEPGNTQRIHGISFELAQYIWDRTMRLYFQDKDEAAQADIRNRVMLLGWLYFLYRMQTDFKGRPLSDIRTAHACEHIEALVGTVQELAV